VGTAPATQQPVERQGGAILVVSDITELRRLEQVRKEFVANASHELKTPLASIRACAETLLDGAWEEDAPRQHFLTTIEEQSERLDKIVRDMLALTRAESDVRPALTQLDLQPVVDLCVQRQAAAAARKSVKVEVQPPPTPVVVLADDEALQQIIDNLLDNAIKYNNDGGTAVVRWRTEGDAAVLDVEDTGIGIPTGQLQRVFERFYRVDKARSREVGGTGLGLSIVRHMVQSLGGNISVQSRLGKGSTFTVRLRTAPVAEPTST
jgi:two-component system phosphate regulon sensor histidine kinase PhoR